VADLGFVYYVRLQDRVKIGWSMMPTVRVRHFGQDAVPLAYEEGARTLERKRHDQFADRRLTGEWFTWCPEIADHVAALPVVEPVDRGRIAVLRCRCDPELAVRVEAQADAENRDVSSMLRLLIEDGLHVRTRPRRRT
jgi:hypothetical protein